jgi:AbrB family looped-hinge helix DNA binding protein
MGRVTEKGQVTIPKPIREELGLEPGDEVDFEATDDGVVLTKQVDESRFERWRGVANTDQRVDERMAELRGERRRGE